MIDALRTGAVAMAERSHAPYSGESIGAAVLLADGRWVAAPRIESASFPLTIPALQGAWSLAALTGGKPVAVAVSRAVLESELAFLAEATGAPWSAIAPDIAALEGSIQGGLPEVALTRTDPTAAVFAGSDEDGLRHAQAATNLAVVPASAFRVGAFLVDVSGRAVSGANVEHESDWTRGLCAERVALVAARAAGLGPIGRIYLACASSTACSPCGGCRQLLVEHAPDAEIVTSRGDGAPGRTTPGALLPGAFDGSALRS